MSRRQRIVTWSAVALVVIILLVAGIVVSLTQTGFGQNQVRAYVQSWVAGKVRGKFYVGRISGGLVNGVTIDSVEIRDEMDSLFLATGPIHVRYDARDLFDRRILLSHVSIEHPVAHIKQHEKGDWNFQRIFPSGPKKPPSTARGFGDYIVMDSADIRNASIVLSLTWHPSDTLKGAKRDSAIKHALGALTRVSPGNQWLSEINRT
ncbi:MAG TPA: hypothetical protein VFC35_05210, partial [Gemmatimonadaceae bacterium]|nr:hypothetical protein [Gemmatimonadaceae bacterium]